ncbi:MAG: LysR family transcriptional regulator [Mitsuaria chitosanitabida]|nr:LysR family transcriptional regulator [Roseateles chitosanitabidus]MBO9686499.1 LysR family transcriptional regulator [Roseateles chitosanitabidus]
MDRIVQMRAFARVVETGSFTKAADSMDLPKASLTRLVQALEARLRVQLLTRTTRKVTVTQDGAVYYERTMALLNELEAIDQGMLHDNSKPRGRLRVDVTTLTGSRVLIPAMADFHERYPDVEIALGVSDRSIDLLVDNVDFVLRVGPVQDAGLVARKVGQIRFVTCASPAYLAAHGTPQDPADLDRAPHHAVGYFSSRTGRVFPFVFHRGDERVEIQGRRRLDVNDSNAYVAAGLAGLGVVQLAQYAVREQVERGELVPLFPDWHHNAVPVYLVYSPNRYVSARMRVFIDWIVETLAKKGLGPT